MKITEDDRLQLRQKLIDAIGDHSTTVLMEAMPPIDYNQLATKGDLALMKREYDADLQSAVGRIVENQSKQLRTIVLANSGTMVGFAGLVLSLS